MSEALTLNVAPEDNAQIFDLRPALRLLGPLAVPTEYIPELYDKYPDDAVVDGNVYLGLE